MADAVNRHDEGVRVVEELHAKYREGAARIEAAGLKGKPVAFVQIWQDWNPVTIYFADSRNGEALDRIGMKNVITTAEMPDIDGIETARRAEVSLEVIAQLDSDNPDLHFVYADSDKNWNGADNYKDSPVWNRLSFVEGGRLYDVDSQQGHTAGPLETGRFVDDVVNALTGKSGTGQTRTISHELGTTEITGTPTRIISLESHITEDLLLLGVAPVGVANIEWTKGNMEGLGLLLPEETVDVGSRSEPNLEVVAQLNPDLILCVEEDCKYDDLSEIAPTVALNPWPIRPEAGEPDMLGATKQTFLTIADITGRGEKGAEIIEMLDNKLEDSAAEIEDAGLAGTEFILVENGIGSEGNTLTLMLSNSITSIVLTEMGLVNVFGDKVTDWGLETSSLEAVAVADRPDIILVNTFTHDNGNMLEFYKDNAVWNNMQVVKDGKVYPVGDLPAWGGIASMEKMVDRIVQALTG